MFRTLGLEAILVVVQMQHVALAWIGAIVKVILHVEGDLAATSRYQ